MSGMSGKALEFRCPHCGDLLLASEERGVHCDGCDDYNEATDGWALPIEQPSQIQAGDIWFFQTFITGGGAVGGQHVAKAEVARRCERLAGPGALIKIKGAWYWNAVEFPKRRTEGTEGTEGELAE